ESLLKAPNIIFPDTKANEVKGFIDQGLQDICVSRTGESWGVKVPGDEEQTIYVWFDALLNYITFLGYPGDISEFWNENTIQVLGKDILSR
ncbi:class I tRNA ligase family protein, partial [Streptomyces brasiliscabiei]|uniref:class I tRNA ligase family protein n=1 Tax=Streptomyces brasiliscabiei TaxID=2736302 RepID=UPI003014B855